MAALTGGDSCMKYLLIIFNFVFWVAGIAVVALGLWLRLDTRTAALFTDPTTVFYTGVNIMMAAGALSMVVGFLGCCGAIKESPCMLGWFFFFLLVICVGLVAAGTWVFFNRESCRKLQKVEICNRELYIIGGVGIGVGLMTIIGMVFSMRLCCVIKRSQ